MQQISTLLEKLTNALLVALLVVLTTSTTLQVITRFITKSPLVWTEEVSRMAFIWMTLLGATLATKHNEHLSLDLLQGRLPKGLEATLQVLLHLMMATVAAVFVVAGWAFVQMNATRISETTGMPMFYLYISGPITGVLMLYYLAEQTPALMDKVRAAFAEENAGSSERGGKR